MSPVCPVCSSNVERLGFAPAQHPLYRCNECGHRFAHATPADLEGLYGASYEGFREDAQFESAVRDLLQREVARRSGAKGSLLDVGCGNGTVLRVATDLGFEAKGIDTSQAAVEHCKQQGLAADVVDFTSDVIEADSYDVITFWDVLEHLIEPARFIDKAGRALRPGGWLLVKVPHHRWLSLSVAASVPRLSRSVLWTPGHLQFFSRESLERVLRKRFDEIAWLRMGAMRSTAEGGSVRRRLARNIVKAIKRASRDGNLLVLARRRVQAVA